MNEELTRVLYELSSMLMANERKEAEAVEGYNNQLSLIDRAQDLVAESGDNDLLPFLDKLEEATKEKITDELNHGENLYAEYVEMTGIKPATD